MGMAIEFEVCEWSTLFEIILDTWVFKYLITKLKIFL